MQKQLFKFLFFMEITTSYPVDKKLVIIASKSIPNRRYEKWRTKRLILKYKF